MKRITYTPADFAWTQWTAEDIKEKANELLEIKRKKHEEIKKIVPEVRTFENTIYILEESSRDLNPFMYKLEVLMEVSPIETQRNASKEALDFIQKELIDIEYDEEIYQAIKDYENKAEELENPEKKLFKDILTGYRRMGFELDKNKREILKSRLKEITELSTEFSKNINDYSDFILVTKDELDGASENYIKGLEQDDKGNYIVTLKYPDLGPFMENVKNGEKRKELAEKNFRKGGEKNLEVLKKLVNLRIEIADLLGYKNFADYITEIKMVKNSANAINFLNDLLLKTEILGRKDLERLAGIKKEITGDLDTKIEFYDVAYYTEQDQKRQFNFDTDKVREYFPFEIVKKGIFDIYSELLSIQFEKLEGYPLWHEDAELYAIKDLKGEILSYFVLDLYPRLNKYNHAGMFYIQQGLNSSFDKDSDYVSPIGSVIANFPKPSSELPSLLSHGEVTTFLHEFGHLMHWCLSEVKYSSQSGTNVAWDFVEAPSQMLENWAWDKEILKKLSGHYLNNEEKLPDDLIDNLIKAKHHMICYGTTRQIILGLFDLTLHTANEYIDPIKLYKDLVEKYTGLKLPENQIFPAGFGHLVGYAAGYYGYLWSEVYAADMFTRFKKEGLLNKQTGADYRSWILSKGSSMEEIDLVRGFLRREPNNKAFFEDLGLK